MSVIIESTRYNNLVQRLTAILGNSSVSSPTTGYGQSINVDSFGVVGSRNQNDLSLVNKISEDQFRKLYIDLVRCRVHQIGAEEFNINSFVIGDYNTNKESTDKIQESYTQGLENLMSEIEVDKFEMDIATQSVIEQLTESSRFRNISGSWNGTLSHIFTVEFESAEDRRHFFNTGGEIRFSAELDYNSSQDKTLKWKTLLNNIGVITFKANRTFSNAGVGSGRNIGNYQLTGSYQLIYRSTGLGTYSGNAYEIYALQNSDNKIQFRIYFADTESERIDENVFGDLTSTVEYARAEGTVNINGIDTDTIIFDKPILSTTISNLA